MTFLRRICLPCIVVLIALGLPAPTAAGSAFEKTCSHYENRARFLERTRPDAFEIVLAKSCRTAIEALAREDAQARIYLERLTELRRTVVTMMIAENREPRAMQRTNARALPRVSPAGEYLIARDLGVISAYREWTGQPGLTLARVRTR